MVKVLVKKLNPNVELPKYKTEGSSGLDLMAFIDNPITFAPNNTRQEVSQDPLKPVWPVTRTFLFLNFF